MSEHRVTPVYLLYNFMSLSINLCQDTVVNIEGDLPPNSMLNFIKYLNKI